MTWSLIDMGEGYHCGAPNIFLSTLTPNIFLSTLTIPIR
jgi:hypothetical protein